MTQQKKTDFSTSSGYRYPGSRPFSDSELDRRLFFGRDQETQYLFHSVLVENLFVLFAKSGMGKTSLLNAGLMELMRRENFLPVNIRFNDRERTPLASVYPGIEEAVKQRNKITKGVDTIDYEPGETESLWQFFKTAEFWTGDDRRLTPILILDQFEEFFTMNSKEEREAFIFQLADLVRGLVPKALRESFKSGERFPYSETAPEVKIIISMREDYLGHLEEMSTAIPGVLKNRFRLLPLNKEAAKDAIIKPARLSEDELVRSKGFSYESEAVDEMLDFLCERMEKGKTVKTDEVEPFQLQLLCQHIEETVSHKKDAGTDGYVVRKKDLGGKTGMRRVMQGFYERRINGLDSLWKKIKVRKLCEKGLIDNRSRLSLEERYITRRFKLSGGLLTQLVDARLLRSEPRVGSLYYELSHDTLVEPILKSRQDRKARRNKIGLPILAVILVLLVITVSKQIVKNVTINNTISKLIAEAEKFKVLGEYEDAYDKHKKILELDKRRVSSYIAIGELVESINDNKYYEDGITFYKQALNIGVNFDRNAEWEFYYRFGKMYDKNSDYENAIKNYKQAIEIDQNLIKPHINLAAVYAKDRKFTKAEKVYHNSLKIKKSVDAYKGLSILYVKQGKYKEALDKYKEAVYNVKDCPECPYIYRDIAYEMKKRRLYRDMEDLYEIASGVDIDSSDYYEKLADQFYYQEKTRDQAIKNYEKALEKETPKPSTYKRLIRLYLDNSQPDKAINTYDKAVEYNPELASIFSGFARELKKKQEIHKLKELCQIAYEFPDQNAYYYAEIGSYFNYLEDHENALKSYEKALELDEKKEFIYNGLAITYIYLRNPGKAIDIYRKAVTINAEFAFIYKDLAEEMNKKGMADDVKKLAQIASQLMPKDPEFYTNRARKFLFSRKYDEAVQYCKEALVLGVESDSLYQEMGTALGRLGKYDEAVESYEKALVLNDKKESIYKNLAITYIYLEKPGKAIDVYRKAVTINAKFAIIYMDLSMEMNKKGMAEDVKKLAQIASKLMPKDPKYYTKRAARYILLRKYDEAVQYYKEALVLGAESDFLYSGMGTALGRQKKYDEAIEYYKKALRLNPGNITAKGNLAELQLITEKFPAAYEQANQLLKNKKISRGSQQGMKFIMVASLLYQRKKSQALAQLEKNFTFNKLSYNKLPYFRPAGWSYDLTKSFIFRSKKLTPDERKLLLTMIDLLSPGQYIRRSRKINEFERLKAKKERGEKIKEFERLKAKVFKK